jgi:hypothetical protein
MDEQLTIEAQRIDNCICGEPRPRGDLRGWHILVSYDPKKGGVVSNHFCPACSELFHSDPTQFIDENGTVH